MNFFKRAVLCCGRQKIRGVILLLLAASRATAALVTRAREPRPLAQSA